MGGVISRIEEVVPAARNTGTSTAIQTQSLTRFLQDDRLCHVEPCDGSSTFHFAIGIRAGRFVAPNMPLILCFTEFRHSPMDVLKCLAQLSDLVCFWGPSVSRGRFSFLEHDWRSISDQIGDPDGVPVCHSHAPVRRGMTDLPRFSVVCATRRSKNSTRWALTRSEER